MEDQLKEAQKMYPGAKYLYRTSDTCIHTTRQGAEAQARHLDDETIETIKCKTLTSRAGSAKPSRA
jgi:hypothetical protein